MQKPLFILFLFLTYCFTLFSQQYTDYFTNKACRIDFQLSGNTKSTNAYV